MITGFHALIYTTDAEADRAFFKDVLELPYVDANGGWLIFELPPSEIGFHPIDTGSRQEFHLMCDDVEATVAELRAKGVEFTQPVTEESYGLVTALRLPGGSELGLYQPRHASPLKHFANVSR